MIKRSQIEEWAIEKVRPYGNNAKLHPEEQVSQIAASIEEFSFLDPISVDENGEILEGHGRLLAAELRGDKTIPVIKVTGLTEAQKVAYRLAHNKINMNSGFSSEFLKLDIEKLDDLNFNLEITGFDINSLDLKKIESNFGVRCQNTYEKDIDLDATNEEAEEDFDDYFQEKCKNDESLNLENEKLILEPRIKEGEIWQLGKHFIFCGSCTNKDALTEILFLLNKSSPSQIMPSIVWADPPYGVKEKTNRKEKGRGDAAECNNFEPIIGDDSNKIAKESFILYLKSFPKAIHFWWGANYFCDILPKMPSWIIWDKRLDVVSDDNADCELAWSNYNKPARIFRHLWKGMIKGSENSERRVHPAQKPIALAEMIFEKHAKENDLILDPFLGSGISILAAEKLGCKDQNISLNLTVAGFEISPHYCEIICQRFEKISPDKTIKLIKKL